MANQIEGIEYSIESIEGGWRRTPGWRFCSTSSQPPALSPTIRSCSTTLHEPQVQRNAALFWQCLKCLKKMCNVQKQPGKTKKNSLISCAIEYNNFCRAPDHKHIWWWSYWSRFPIQYHFINIKCLSKYIMDDDDDDDSNHHERIPNHCALQCSHSWGMSRPCSSAHIMMAIRKIPCSSLSQQKYITVRLVVTLWHCCYHCRTIWYETNYRIPAMFLVLKSWQRCSA